eukprot:TRINITY_DN18133_c0_g1_i1.p1 TRINITY_DN18133_c0_g1~~TRINITY_DN18133_c0_g1_i1.p1  ORF type:complete len:119 (-),score=17.59 TRINITY_DN18133_c0_g1_i1:1443-1799(-)
MSPSPTPHQIPTPNFSTSNSKLQSQSTSHLPAAPFQASDFPPLRSPTVFPLSSPNSSLPENVQQSPNQLAIDQQLQLPLSANQLLPDTATPQQAAPSQVLSPLALDTLVSQSPVWDCA